MIIAIDPGIEYGYAMFTGRDGEWMPVQWGMYDPSKEKRWETKLPRTMSHFIDLMHHYDVEQVWMEMPGYRDDEVGNTSARSGALVKLSFIVGAFYGVCAERDIPCDLIPVNRWKGQLPKEVVIKRIKAVCGDIKAQRHAWDAIGLGLYKMGKING